jgi:hypothetical protein
MVYETPEMRRRVAEMKKFYRICQAYSDKIEKWLASPSNEAERQYLDGVNEALDNLISELTPFGPEELESLRKEMEKFPENPWCQSAYHFYKLFHQKLPEEEEK